MSSPEIREIVASDGTPLKYRLWGSSGSRGVVVCLHGIQSHSGWYTYSSQCMSEAGFVVYFADRRGSGLNERQRGHADHADRLLNDVVQLIRHARREYPGLKMTLLGLSWGGKIAAALARRRPELIDRLVLLYPGLVSRIRPNLWQRFLLWFAGTHDIRHREVPLPLGDAALFTDDVDWQEFIRNDELALRSVTTGLLNAGMTLDRMFRESTQALPPTLLMLAGQDQIVDNVRTRSLIASAAPKNNLCAHEYDHARHTLEFDQNREKMFRDLVDWLKSV